MRRKHGQKCIDPVKGFVKIQDKEVANDRVRTQNAPSSLAFVISEKDPREEGVLRIKQQTKMQGQFSKSSVSAMAECSSESCDLANQEHC